MKLCPKCNEKGKFGYFDAPDKIGVHAMFTHKTNEYETITDCMGIKRVVRKTRRCFLTLEDLKKTDWFSRWLTQREEENKRYVKEQEDYWNSQYQKDYFNSLDMKVTR